MRVSRSVVLIAMLLAFASSAAFAATYYVAPNGLDTNPGTITQPWLTLNQANYTVQAGDTVNVRAGTYSGSLNELRPRADGTPSAPITYTSYDGYLAAKVNEGMNIMAHAYINLSGFEASSNGAMGIHVQPSSDLSVRSHHVNVSNCWFHNPVRYDTIKLNQSDYLTFTDCEISGPSGDEELDAVWVDYVTFTRCFVHDYDTIGITFKGGSHYPILEQCVIAHAINDGVKATRFGGATDAKYRDPSSTYASQYAVYRNNIIRDCRSPAGGDYECWYAYFYNNTVVEAGGSATLGIIAHHADPKYSGDGGSAHVYWFNNLFLDLNGDMIAVYNNQSDLRAEDWVDDYNSYYNNGNPIPSGTWAGHDPNLEAHSTFGNPNLANQTGTATTYAGWKDCFRITAASTTLIDRGSSTAGNTPRPAVLNDIDGLARPQGGGWDIGAFELVSGPVPPVANFTGNPTSGSAPLTVAFTDTSSGSPTSWSWTFGDGGTSTAHNPSHVYAAGTYTVSLTATNAYGSDSETKTNYITAVTAQDYTCASLTVNNGTIASGDHTSVHASDNVYLVITAAKVSSKYTAQVSYTINTGLGSLSSLVVTTEGKVSTGTQPLTVYAYNYSTSTWTSIATGTLTTTDSTVTPTVSNPSQYLSGGTVQVRVKVGGTGSTAFSNSTDLVKITAAP